jgi:hypothetical protein
MLKLLADEEPGLSANPGLGEPHKQTDGTADDSATAHILG